MESPLPHDASQLRPILVWLGRARFLLGALIVWAALHYVADGLLLSRGLHRPTVVVAAAGAWLTIPIVGLLLVFSAYIAVFVAGRRSATDAVELSALGLALWAMSGGTMDDWLALCNEAPSPPHASPYLLLLADYFYFAAVLGLVAAAGAIAGIGSRGSPPGDRNEVVRQALGLQQSPSQIREGLTALVVTVAVAGAVMFILMGPRAAQTHRGQVYFAVAVGFIAGVIAARRVTTVRFPIWFWAAPLVLGIIGLLLAAWNPGLPAPYNQLNIVPASGLARPLPVEMIGVGVVASVWMLRSMTHSGEHPPLT